MALETVEIDNGPRLVSPEPEPEDFDSEASLRPKTLEEYIGQDKDVYKRQVQYCRMGRGAVACGRCRKERCTAVCSVGGGMPGAFADVR